MLPLVFSHEAKSRHWPLVTICLIGLNVLIFLFEWSLGSNGLEVFIQDWGLIPARVAAGVSLHNLGTVISSMFMHASWSHIFFNMWFLYIFGDSLEDALGRWWYLMLYLVAGFFGLMTFIATSGSSPIPTLGASGAVSGVLGASLVIWPTARLNVPGILLAVFSGGLLLDLSVMVFGGAGYLVGLPLGVMTFFGLLMWFVSRRGLSAGIFGFQPTPAWFVFGMYLGLNLWSGVATIVDPVFGGGVGYWAHIGGFVTGALFGWLFPKTPIALKRRRVLD
jgi:membrane associated rhomboid family serine protease